MDHPAPPEPVWGAYSAPQTLWLYEKRRVAVDGNEKEREFTKPL